MAKRDAAKLKKVSVSLPFGIGSAEWESDLMERRAAWSLYVELVTRIAVQPLETDAGLLREALTSLHGLFATTRQILKEAGPDIGASNESVGGIAIAVLINAQRKPEKVNETYAFSSEQESDYYTRLEELLAAEKWLEADQETKKVILKISGKEQKGQLDAEDCRKLPCQYLREIDQLWVKYSKHQFGLSVQQRIWKNLGGSKGANYETFQRFGECVGWFVAGSWSKNLVFNLSASEGHLPYCRAWLYSNRQTAVVSRFSSLISRLEECDIQPKTTCIKSTIKPEFPSDEMASSYTEKDLAPSEKPFTQGKEAYVNTATENSTIWDDIQSFVGVILGLALMVGILSHFVPIPLFNQWQKQIFPTPEVSPTSRYRQM